MSYTNVYPSRINWENEPSIQSPINATNLNKMDYALYEHDRTLENWATTKANQSDLLLSVKSIDYDTETGVFVFTWQNGTTKTIDLNIEKIPVSFSMSPEGVITMTTDDGTSYTADVGSLIKTYTFADSSVIDFTVTTDSSGNKTVTANIVDGSITGDKLQPNYLADCQTAKQGAESAAGSASNSSEDAEAWAKGTRNGVPVPSTDPAYENNSKYWAEHTSNQLAGLSDVDISNVQDGDILAYNGAASKWKNGKPTAGGGSKIKVTTSESTLYGEDVTLTQGTTTLTATFDSYGVAIFEGVTLTGNVTLTASDGQSTSTRTLNIPYFGNYEVVMAFFSATINVTYPSGATCTITDGTTTLTATSNPMAFDIPNAGTWTATATLDGVSKQGTPISITTDGQTASDTIIFGTINLTISDEFRGLSIVCAKDGVIITKTAPSSGNTMVFYPPTTGTWVISGTYQGDTYSVNANVSSLSTPVSVNLETIPNGKTVTPTDDIQTWLKCAGINDKAYTTLTEVLADVETFTALLQDSNASDYMARSTTWTTTICADADAMRRVGMYDYCSNALLGNSTWANAICNSTYFESVLNVKVPTMTDNTHPSGECVASTEYYPAYKAFNGGSEVWAKQPSDADPSIGYIFTSPTIIKKIEYTNGPQSGETTGSIIVQGYNGSTWSDITSAITTVSTAANAKNTVIFDNNTEYLGYRIHPTDRGASQSWNLTKLQFYGRHEAQTNIIHSAADDTLYYMNGSTEEPLASTDSSGKGSVTWSDLPVGELTIYSTKAKNLSNLTDDYSKTIRITPNTVEVYLIPDNTLYWWGYNNGMVKNTSGVISPDQSGATTIGTVTFNVNNILLTNPNAGYSQIVTENTVDLTNVSKVCAIANTANGYTNVRFGTNSGQTAHNYGEFDTQASIAYKDCNVTNKTDNKIFCGIQFANLSVNIYALWYE